MEDQYGSEKQAWEALSSDLVAEAPRGAGHDGARGVPFAKWREVWLQQPGKDAEDEDMQGSSGWQASFHLADSDDDGLVQRSEFNRLYRLAASARMADSFFGALHEAKPVSCRAAWMAALTSTSARGHPTISPDG